MPLKEAMPLNSVKKQNTKKEDRTEVWIRLECGLSVTWEGLWIGSTGSAQPLAALPEKA